MPADDIERRVAKLESRLDSVVNSLNKVNQTTHDHIVALERKFAKLDKSSQKLNKMTDKRIQQKSIGEIVDKAIQAYDKAQGKKG